VAQRAYIHSPEVIRRFRTKLLEFDGECRKAIDGARTNVQRILDWLQREQLFFWKRELQRRREEEEEARRAWTLARSAPEPVRRSAEDERKALKRAVRRREKAEEKLRAVKKWILVIGREATRNLKPCDTLASRLATLTPRAVQRLDRMMENLEIYLRAVPSPPPPAGGEDAGEGKEGD